MCLASHLPGPPAAHPALLPPAAPSSRPPAGPRAATRRSAAAASVRNKRRDALEPVGGEGAPEAHAVVHADGDLAGLAPPQKALRPPISSLHRAEREGGLCIDYVAPSTSGRAWCASRQIADCERPRELMYSGELDDTLAHRYARIDSLLSSIACVGRDARFLILLHDQARCALARSICIGARLPCSRPPASRSS